MRKENENETPVYGNVCKRKLRRKRQRLLLTELFLDFSKNTTLHGLRYITQIGLETIEKRSHGHSGDGRPESKKDFKIEITKYKDRPNQKG
ncbi:unnamed protein product [Diatraea saccharalis]|uniref:Uncharacterized protein n=1 Tax=Diatraea saccharalis TaxID=40085 RepID=A0A9N9REP4_9NEOP|nr:unnamed protein product [Diatraea saccharalis]